MIDISKHIPKKLKLKLYWIVSFLSSFMAFSVVLVCSSITQLILELTIGGPPAFHPLLLISAVMIPFMLLRLLLNYEFTVNNGFQLFNTNKSPIRYIFGRARKYDITNLIMMTDLVDVSEQRTAAGIPGRDCIRLKLHGNKVNTFLSKVHEQLGHKYISFYNEYVKDDDSGIDNRIYVLYLFDEDLLVLKLLLGE